MQPEDDDSRPRTEPPAGPGSSGANAAKSDVRTTDRLRKLRHELRTPLNQIIGYAELLEEEAEDRELDDFVADLQKIQHAGRRLLGLVDELSVLSPAPVPKSIRVDADAAFAATVPPAPVDEGVRLSPLPGEAMPAGGASSRAALAPGDSTKSARLLVVDDHPLNRDMLARRLERSGYQVRSAEGGREALAMIEQEPFELVLLDVMMPEVSGIDVLTTVRAHRGPADLPIIMVTARDASEDVVEALGLGANDYVTKPIDFSVALARVATHLALKKAKDEIEALALRLQQAQERIDELSASSDEAAADVESWAAIMAPKVAAAVGADAIEVSLFEPQERGPCAASGGDTLISTELRRALSRGEAVDTGQQTLVPIRGTGAESHGALIVHGLPQGWGTPDRRLLDSFARQLGSAIEMKQMRAQLESATDRRRVRQRDLVDQGVGLLRICPECGRCYDQDTSRCDADLHALPPAQTFPYRISGRYRLVRVCGEGGMGTVYHGFDERLDRHVAVKVIKSEHYNNEAARRRFDHEARVVARIDHPSVIGVYDSGELDDGSLFIVMEWLDGCDLGEILRRCGRGTPAQVAAVVRQGAAALAAAHDAGLVHRDIKPDNVYLVHHPEGFRVKLLDFGVAKEVSGAMALTQTNAIIGTPLYMAPEQLLQKPVDARSDYYSFAAVIYQALTGRRVTVATEFADIVIDVVHTMPPTVSTLLPDAPAEVDQALEAALSKAPQARPAALRPWAEALAGRLDEMSTTCQGWLTPKGRLDVERCPPAPSAGDAESTRIV